MHHPRDVADGVIEAEKFGNLLAEDLEAYARRESGENDLGQTRQVLADAKAVDNELHHANDEGGGGNPRCAKVFSDEENHRGKGRRGTGNLERRPTQKRRNEAAHGARHEAHDRWHAAGYGEGEIEGQGDGSHCEGRDNVAGNGTALTKCRPGREPHRKIRWARRSGGRSC